MERLFSLQINADFDEIWRALAYTRDLGLEEHVQWTRSGRLWWYVDEKKHGKTTKSATLVLGINLPGSNNIYEFNERRLRFLQGAANQTIIEILGDLQREQQTDPEATMIFDAFLANFQQTFQRLGYQVIRVESTPATTGTHLPTETRKGTMIATDLPPCPFVAGPMITDPRLFVGRKEELQTLLGIMTGVQPVSVNVVGERRIGKSSLLFRFYQIWSQWVDEPQKYLVLFQSLQDGRCRKEKDFYQRIVVELTRLSSSMGAPNVRRCLDEPAHTRKQFAQVIECIHAAGVLPVFCLDEFDALFEDVAHFDDAFFDGLRSLMDTSQLMLIVATRRSLQFYKKKKQLDSSFFNLGHTLYLDLFSEEEARDLVRLPASTVPGAQAALSLDEQEKALAWGKRHPFLLQLAATYLCEARQRGKSIVWAQNRFERNAMVVPSRREWKRWLMKIPKWVVVDALRQLGALAAWIAENIDDMKKWLIGAGILLLIVLILLHRIDQEDLVNLLTHLFGG